MSCPCGSTPGTPQPCSIHWPDYTVRSIEAGASKVIKIGIDVASGRTAIAAMAINKLGELLLPHVPADMRGIMEELWARFGPVAIQSVTVLAPSVTVIDERGPGSTVDLVDERTPQTATPRD